MSNQEEQHEIDSNPYNRLSGVDMPFQSHPVQYQKRGYIIQGLEPRYGYDERDIQLTHQYEGTLEAQTSNSQNVGAMQTREELFNSDGSRFFNDAPIHPDMQSQVDQMQGVVNDRRVSMLYNEDVWPFQRTEGIDWSVNYPSGSEFQPGADEEDYQL
jgi:hypothetical protein